MQEKKYESESESESRLYEFLKQLNKKLQEGCKPSEYQQLDRLKTALKIVIQHRAEK